MIRFATGLAMSFLVWTNGAQAQDVCGRLMQEFEHEGKAMSLTWADGVGDNSAPRATLKQMEINNFLLLRQINLTLMINNKCALPKEPVSMIEYARDALSCSSDRLKTKEPPSCEMARWVREKK